MISKQHASGVFLHRASAVQNQTAGGRTNGLRQAKSLAKKGFAIDLLVALVAAFYFLIAKLQCHLEGCKGIKSLGGNNCLGSYFAGSNNSSFELFYYFLPPVIVVKIWASV